MRVIIDTNVLVSAILKDRKPEEIIVFVVTQPDFEWIISQEILTEYKEVIGRKKFGLSLKIQQEWLDIIDAFTTIIDINLKIDFPRDPKDAKFLACALAADADYFVTGDPDFEEAQKLVNTKIISVSLFKKLVCETLN